MRRPIVRAAGLAATALWSALAAAGCSFGVHENERAVLESTPHSTPAPYAVSREAYRDHMMERFKGMSSKSYGKEQVSKKKRSKKS